MRLIILLVAWAIASTGHAHHTQNHAIEELVDDAYSVWGGRMGEPPQVQIISRDQFDTVVCGRPCGRSIVAAYLNGIIYLHDTWDHTDIWQASYLIHELIHHLQYQAGLHPKTPSCEDAWRLEYQAYEMQNRWLVRYQKFIPRTMLLRLVAMSTGCQLDQPLLH